MQYERLKKRLILEYPSHLICDRDTDLVIEGYPRSASSFMVGMIELLCRRRECPPPRMAHHTHSPDQLKLAKLLGLPIVLLARCPADAVLSYHIFSRLSIEQCIERYRVFYESALRLDTPMIVVEFAIAVSDFNSVIRRINSGFSLAIPQSDDVENDTKLLSSEKYKRAVKVHGDQAVRRVGMPNAGREKIKRHLRDFVIEKLDKNPEISRIFEEVISMKS